MMKLAHETYYGSSQWSFFFGFLGRIEQRLLCLIALKPMTVAEISKKSLCNPEKILPLLQEMELLGVAAKCGGELFPCTYFLCNKQFEDYCKSIDSGRLYNPEDICRDLAIEFRLLAEVRLQRVNELGLEVVADQFERIRQEYFFLAAPKNG